MAQSDVPFSGQKRGPGRPSKLGRPVEKKRKISSALDTPVSSSVQSAVESSPAPEKRSTGLPAKVTDHRRLPTLPEPQPLFLPKEEYQSIAASAVLQSSLDRSRLKWIYEGIFERYWVKPESGKNARPPPPNNPDLKLQKHRGPCRIRIEPHILEAEIYVEEKPKPPPAQVKQYVPPNYQRSAFGQPYQPNHPPYGHQQQQQYYHNRNLPPIQHQAHAHAHVHPHPLPLTQPNPLPPINNLSHQPTPPPQSSRPPPPPSPQPQQDKKASPDPVISMLANRASSDPELKALMKEVATGNASQEQLKIFQGHIDELTKIINDKKKKEEGEDTAASTSAEVAKPSVPQNETIQYDGAADSKPHQQQPSQPSAPAPAPAPPVPAPAQAPAVPPAPAANPGYPQPQHQPQWSPAPPAPPPPPPAPSPQPVIIGFTTPGATEDRFLFPQNSIIEALSPQHLFVSFIVTRKGREAVDSTGLEPDTEYWQPVTLMVEVAYNREHILECVRRWVKPAEEVKKHMEDVMARCTKAPSTYLALRLPFKGSAMAEVEETAADSAGASDRALEDRVKPKSSGKYVKKTSSLVKSEVVEPSVQPEETKEVTVAKDADVPAPATQEAVVEQKDTAIEAGKEAEKETSAATESGRPRRAVRKSVRISEG